MRAAAARLLAAFSLAFGVATVKAADWTRYVADDWLAVVAVEDLARVEERVAKLLQPWGMTPPRVSALLAGLPADAIANRPWVVIVEAPPGSRAGFTARLLAPIDDFAAACGALGVEAGGDVAVASLGGVEIALRRLDGWVEAAPVDDLSDVAEPGDPADPSAWPLGEPAARGADVSLWASPEALARVAEWLEQAPSGRRPNADWRGKLAALRSRAKPYAAGFRTLAAMKTPLAASVGQDDEEATWWVTLGVPSTGAVTPSDPVAPASDRSAAIGWLAVRATPPSPIIDVCLAVLGAQAAEIEADEYPPLAWGAYATALRRLAESLSAIDATLTWPADGEPLAANERLRFRESPTATSPFAETLRLATVRWNQLIEAAEARSPLRVDLAAIDDTGGGWRLAIDMVEGLGLPRSPETTALIARFYGAGGLWTHDIRSLGGGEWLATRQGAAPTPTTPPAARAGPLLEGELRLDRWIAWSERIDAVGQESTVGRRVRPPMAPAPPLRLEGEAELGSDGLHRLRLRLLARDATNRSLAAWWRQPPAPAR